MSCKECNKKLMWHGRMQRGKVQNEKRAAAKECNMQKVQH